MVSILWIVFYALISTAYSKSSREEEFARITHYELIHIDLTLFVSERIIEFDAFDHHYKIQLIPNHDLVASHIRHTGFDPTSSPEQYITSSTSSCHYFGTLLDAPSDDTTIALSLCNNRGIRGRITAFNETILIKPSSYYFDFANSVLTGHTLSDELFVYRTSDFNTTDIGRASAIDAHPNRLQKQLIKTVNNKRRLYTAYSPAQTEVLVVNGPLRTLRYQNDYGSRWYEVLVSDLMDVFNGVSALYASTSWPSSVGGRGSITVKLVELEIVFAFTGRYATLRPNYYYSNCQSSYTECNVNGQNWLGKFRTWVAIYKDVSTFDTAQLISDIAFETQTSGWGNIAVICRGSSSVADIYEGWGLDFMVRTIAHELGHNYGMDHDGQAGGEGEACDINDGLMGYGNGEGFSWCSLQSLQNYFLEQSGLTCLTKRDLSFTSNYDDDGGAIDPTPQPTPRPTPRPTTRAPVSSPIATPRPTARPTPRPTARPTSTSGSDTDWECLGMRGVDIATLNGYWHSTGTNDGKTAYALNGFYLYYLSAYNWWLISNELGSLSDLKGYCRGNALVGDCSGAFKVYTSSSGWADQTSSTFYDCSDSGSTDTGTGSTDLDFVCAYFETLVIVGMTVDKYGRSYNGEWYPSGCHNGESYYMKSGDSSRYLCKSSDFNFWIISDALCGKTAFAYSPISSGDLIATQNNWNVLGASGWATDTDVWLAADQPYTDQDLSCLEDNVYSDSLCVYSNDTLWNGERTFTLNTKLCRNGEPLYYYIEYDENAEEDAFGNNNDEIQTIYHLHFHRELRYSDGNETIGQWMISKNEISIDAIAVCEEDDVLECVETSWIVDDYSLTEHDQFDGLLRKMVDHYMRIDDGACGYIKDDDKDDVINLDMLPYIGGGIVAFIALCVLSINCYRQRKMKAGTLKMIRSYESDDDEKKVDVESDEEQHHDVEAANLTSRIHQ